MAPEFPPQVFSDTTLALVDAYFEFAVSNSVMRHAIDRIDDGEGEDEVVLAAIDMGSTCVDTALTRLRPIVLQALKEDAKGKIDIEFGASIDPMQPARIERIDPNIDSMLLSAEFISSLAEARKRHSMGWVVIDCNEPSTPKKLRSRQEYEAFPPGTPEWLIRVILRLPVNLRMCGLTMAKVEDRWFLMRANEI